MRICVYFAGLYSSPNYLENNLQDYDQKQHHSKVSSKKHVLTAVFQDYGYENTKKQHMGQSVPVLEKYKA